jgi:hypothetical protein
MATVALIQNLYPALNAPDPSQLAGVAQQMYHKFFEVLVEESGHIIQLARHLDDYWRDYEGSPDLVICAPFPQEGNVAPGFVELQTIQNAFPGVPVIVWASRDEASIKASALNDYGVAHYYTGTLLDSPGDFADLILEYT